MTDRERAIDVLKRYKFASGNLSDTYEITNAMNTAIEALKEEPRKKGKWIYHFQDGGFDRCDESFYTCSECGHREDILCGVNYCSHCGADNRKEN